MKLCGRPPSKPSIQSTCKESADWFVIEQFCKGNGRPKKRNHIILYLLNKVKVI